MVATTDPVASEIGAEILRRGGSAIDAGIATFFALAVVNPEAGNLGGGGFLVAVAPNGDRVALDFREVAPSAATRDMFVGPDGRPTNASREGARSIGVPGSVAGMWALHRRYGAVPWNELLEPAIHLAEGIVVHERLASSMRNHAARLSVDPETARVFLPRGVPPRVGERFEQRDLAATLRRIAAEGRDGFYLGVTAQRIAEAVGRRGGLIKTDDLAAYEAVWREPTRFTYRQHTVFSMPPPSSGGPTLALVFQILDRHDVRALGWHSVDHLHLFAEAEKRAFVERNAVLADPGFAPLEPMERMTSAGFAETLDATIPMDRAIPASEIVSQLRAPEARGTSISEGAHTTHFSIVDARGGAIGITTTLNDLYGARITAEGTGVLLNDEMDDFTSLPGAPNMFGLVQGEANAIAPGKRMLSSMSPTIVLSPEGRIRLVTGSPGGSTIISSVACVVSNVLDFGMDLPRAIAAPRVHHQHLPDALMFESGGLAAETIQSLSSRGHTLTERTTPAYQGDVQSILVSDDGTMIGAADPRKGGAPVGVIEGPTVVH